MKTLIHRRSTLLLLLLLTAISFGLFLSCSEPICDGLPITEYNITIEEIPEALPVGVDLYFPIIVRLEPVNPEIDSLFCGIYDSENVPYLEFYLYDDGSAYDHPTESALLSVRSGDNVPGDGRFTRQITGQNFEGEFGTYVFFFETPDG